MNVKRARLEAAAGAWLRTETIKVGNHYIASDMVEQAEEAGKRLRDIFVKKLASGSFTAEELVEICWYHSISCGLGCDDLMVNPEHAHRNGSQHIKRALALTHELAKTEPVRVPAYSKIACTRMTSDIACQRPKQRMHDDYMGVVDAAGDDPLVGIGFSDFENHPARIRALAQGIHWSKIIPIAMYWDGVRYTKHENFEAFYWQDLRTQVRYLGFVTLRADMCQCGCLGWCTLYPLLLFYAEDFNHGALVHCVFADGTVCQVVLCVCESRSDWPALTSFMGLRTCAHNLSPCFCCTFTKIQMLAGLLNGCGVHPSAFATAGHVIAGDTTPPTHERVVLHHQVLHAQL